MNERSYKNWEQILLDNGLTPPDIIKIVMDIVYATKMADKVGPLENSLYFAKYLPVEGEIKEFERAHLTEEIEIENPKIGTDVVTTSDHLSFLFKDKQGYHFCVKKHHGTGASGITLQIGEFKKVKLFLCSRNLQVGDKVRITFSDKEWEVVDIVGAWRLKNGEEIIGTTPSETFKVIGEISPNALWVKEGDEFDENQLEAQGVGVNWDKSGSGYKFKIKCFNCGRFH
jgi:hypothetical protein